MRELLVAVADIIIMLDDNYVVIGVTDPMNIDNLTLWKWMGRKVVDVVSPESAAKLARILRDETADASTPDRWRHVNFLDAAGRSIPLLVKYFNLTAGPVTKRLIVGRDLRPMEEAQKRFQKALDEMHARPPESGATAPSQYPSAALEGVLGSKPFDVIVAETMEILERTFFAEALKRANGDTAAAAGLLGLEEADFLRRLRGESSG